MQKLSIENIKKASRGEGGFTLIELLVTVTIIGVLAAVVSIGVGGATTSSQTAANKGTFNQVQAAVDAYVASGGVVADIQGTDSTITDWYNETGLVQAGAPAVGDKSVTISKLKTDKWLRTHANTALACFFVGATTTLKGCK